MKKLKLDHLRPDVAAAVMTASEELTRLKIRHALIGGVAVGQYGYERATKDVDFLLGDEAYDKGLILVFKKPTMPLKVQGVAIDYLAIPDDAVFLERELHPPKVGQTDVVGVPALVYMKLLAGRARDKSDVIELVKAGINTDAIYSYLRLHAPGFAAPFTILAKQARTEDD